MMAGQSYIFDEADIAALRDVVRAVRGASGPGVSVGPGRLDIGRQPDRARQANLDPAPFLAKITGHTEIVAGARWSYTFEEVRPSTTAGGTEDVAGGRTGTAYNLVEASNTTAGAIGGDGVNPAGADYPAGFARRPIGGSGTSDTHAVDVPVFITTLFDTNGKPSYWFSQVNAHDGSCT